MTARTVATLNAVSEKTGQSIGTLTFDGKKITAEGAALQPVTVRRHAGMKDPDIWAQLAGWSNGYLTFREEPADQTAAVVDLNGPGRGSMHEFCRNPLHPGPCADPLKALAKAQRKAEKVTPPRAAPHPVKASAVKTSPHALRGLSDEDLAGRFADISRKDKLDEPALRAVIAEMDRREKPGKARAKYTPTPATAAVDEHLEKTGDLRGALAAGVDRRKGESLDKAVARAHDEWIDMGYLRAEQKTRGHMLSPAGKAARVDPRTLFTGPIARARKYASEELQRWWTDNPRLNRTQFRAQVLGRASDVKAARAVRAGSNGKDFI